MLARKERRIDIRSKKMTLNFQNKIVFPAPETSYTTQSAFGQVIYLPRNIMKRVENKFKLNKQNK